MAQDATVANALNLKIARRLDEVAQILNEQGANPFRVQAYRTAAANLRRLSRPVDDILQRQGEPGLREIPGIGQSLARAIATLVLTGRLPVLDRLRGESDAGLILASVPGIGKVLAARLHHELGIDTLEQLEATAHDGRLRDLIGLGEKRIAGIIDSLASRLGRVQIGRASANRGEPSVGEILDVDREYREKAAAGQLRTIAPRRFNPDREAWLPILHSQRGQRHYTALFSNTARAHELKKTKDWVVIYYDGPGGERQCTVITSQRGSLAGQRIVRGRETECEVHYRRGEVTGAVTENQTKMRNDRVSNPVAARS
jgi:predicted flap endonuclease-1-like 5' DNA nuclease